MQSSTNVYHKFMVLLGALAAATVERKTISSSRQHLTDYYNKVQSLMMEERRLKLRGGEERKKAMHS
jgi:hypothetical protein